MFFPFFYSEYSNYTIDNIKEWQVYGFIFHIAFYMHTNMGNEIHTEDIRFIFESPETPSTVFCT